VGLATANGTLITQVCNDSTVALPQTANQKVALWRVVGPTP
jgi:hypothetical protein